MLLTLRVQIANIKKPPVWRKLIVPAQFTFHQLHLVIQASFGWENYHLYLFSEEGHQSDVVICEPMGEDDWREEKDSSEVRLSEVLTTVGKKYMYLYDFGDDWQHNITVEKIDDSHATHADCLAGKGACPPEDCGGPWGYEALKETLANPKHPEYKEMKEWLGLEDVEKWDANFFDLEEARERLGDGMIK